MFNHFFMVHPMVLQAVGCPKVVAGMQSLQNPSYSTIRWYVFSTVVMFHEGRWFMMVLWWLVVVIQVDDGYSWSVTRWSMSIPCPCVSFFYTHDLATLGSSRGLLNSGACGALFGELRLQFNSWGVQLLDSTNGSSKLMEFPLLFRDHGRTISGFLLRPQTVPHNQLV